MKPARGTHGTLSSTDIVGVSFVRKRSEIMNALVTQMGQECLPFKQEAVVFPSHRAHQFMKTNKMKRSKSTAQAVESLNAAFGGSSPTLGSNLCRR